MVLTIFCLGLNLFAAETTFKVNFDILKAGKSIAKANVLTKINEPATLVQEKDGSSITLVVTPSESQLNVKGSVFSKSNSKDNVSIDKIFTTQNNSTEIFNLKSAEGIEYTFKIVTEKNKATK
jgi:hypothetical protein